jgi:predicted PurR-regulated permease PerM
LALSPLAVFVGLVFWSWIWGVPGTFLAVPLLATFRIVCDRVDALKPVGMLLKG